MTHCIESWQQPTPVKAIQTTRVFKQHLAFDMHPKQSNPKFIQQLVTEFGLPHPPVFLQQVHSNRVIEYSQQPDAQSAQQADACFTRQKDVVCAVLAADCLPVLLTDTAGSFVAAVHCGWRGLYADILSHTLKQINPQHQVLAWLGPCIQQPQYEVDESFVNKYLIQQPNSRSAFTAIKAGKSQACLVTMARIQLNTLNVKHIETANQCTYLSPNLYSWRQNNTSKRQASLLWLSTKHTV